MGPQQAPCETAPWSVSLASHHTGYMTAEKLYDIPDQTLQLWPHFAHDRNTATDALPIFKTN